MKMLCVGGINFLVVNKSVTAKDKKVENELATSLYDGTTQRSC